MELGLLNETKMNMVFVKIFLKLLNLGLEFCMEFGKLSDVSFSGNILGAIWRVIAWICGMQ